MKNIGTKLKDKREENGLSIEEVAEDLKMRPSQISSIEEGKTEDFKDVFYLKYFIRDYAKYLGLDGDILLDELNEYLFEQTSRISLSDIEEARKLKEESEKDMKIISPYTVSDEKNSNLYILLGGILILIVIAIMGYVGFSNSVDKEVINSKISYKLGE